MVTDGEWGSAATVVKNHGLGLGGERFFDGVEEGRADQTALGKMCGVFEVNDGESGGFCMGQCESVE